MLSFIRPALTQISPFGNALKKPFGIGSLSKFATTSIHPASHGGLNDRQKPQRLAVKTKPNTKKIVSEETNREKYHTLASTTPRFPLTQNAIHVPRSTGLHNTILTSFSYLPNDNENAITKIIQEFLDLLLPTNFFFKFDMKMANGLYRPDLTCLGPGFAPIFYMEAKLDKSLNSKEVRKQNTKYMVQLCHEQFSLRRHFDQFQIHYHTNKMDEVMIIVRRLQFSVRPYVTRQDLEALRDLVYTKKATQEDVEQVLDIRKEDPYTLNSLEGISRLQKEFREAILKFLLSSQK